MALAIPTKAQIVTRRYFTGTAPPIVPPPANSVPFSQTIAEDSPLIFSAVANRLISVTAGQNIVQRGFFGCFAVKVNSGTGTVRTIWSDAGTNSGYKVQINANNRLQLSAGNGAVFVSVETVNSIVLGIVHVFTAWYDGTSLNVQIDSGAVATTAVPLTSVGTLGFELMKDNGAATGYTPGNLYSAIYYQNTGLNAAQRAEAQIAVRNDATAPATPPATSQVLSDLYLSGAKGLWLDQSDTATDFQDTAATVAVTAVEQPLGRRNDKSGRAMHVLQSVAVNRTVLSARFNRFANSEIFSGWGGAGSLALDNAAGLGPNGGPLHRLIGDVNAYQGGPQAPGTNRYSMFAKAGGSTRMYVGRAGFVSAEFDLSAGTVISSQPGTTGSVAAVTGGYRIEISFSDLVGATQDLYIGIVAGFGAGGVLVGEQMWHVGPKRPYQRRVSETDYAMAGFTLFDRFSGVEGYSTAVFAAGTLTSNMDLFIAMTKDSADALTLMHDVSTSAAPFIGASESAGVGEATQGCGTTKTHWINGIQVPGGTATTAGQLHSFLPLLAYPFILEIRNLNMSGWTQVQVSSFVGRLLKGKIYSLVLCEAQTNLNRSVVRQILATAANVVLPDPAELIQNPMFAQGLANYTSSIGTYVLSSEERTGGQALRVGSELAQSILVGRLVPGQAYTLKTRAKLLTGTKVTVSLTFYEPVNFESFRTYQVDITSPVYADADLHFTVPVYSNVVTMFVRAPGATCTIDSFSLRTRAPIPLTMEIVDTTNSYVPAGYALAFNDEFNQATLDRNKWFTRYMYNNETLASLSDERQRYADNNNHVMQDGMLKLTARDVDPANFGARFQSGMIRSDWTTHYGYFEARVKMPGGKGVFPAFWIDSSVSERGTKGWPPEYDFFEFVVNEGTEHRNMIHTGVIQTSYAAPNAQVISSIAGWNNQWGYWTAPYNFNERFTTIGYEWLPPVAGSINGLGTTEMFIDGVSIVKKTAQWLNSETPSAFGGPAHVMLNFAVGGSGWAGANGVDETAFPQSLDIMWVRVYKKTS